MKKKSGLLLLAAVLCAAIGVATATTPAETSSQALTAQKIVAESQVPEEVENVAAVAEGIYIAVD